MIKMNVNAMTDREIRQQVRGLELQTAQIVASKIGIVGKELTDKHMILKEELVNRGLVK